jgi:hypothetical protein
MDEMMRYIVSRNPATLMYKAIFEMTDELTYPVNSRLDLLKQLCRSDRPMEAQDDVVAMIEETLPAHYFPLTCKQNALEKITEAVEQNPVELDGSAATQPTPRWSPDPHNPVASEFECWRRHREAILDLMEAGLTGDLSPADIMAGTRESVAKLQECLRACHPSSITP